MLVVGREIRLLFAIQDNELVLLSSEHELITKTNLPLLFGVELGVGKGSE